MYSDGTSETRSTTWWDQVSHQFDPLQLPKRGIGPLSVRGLLGGGKELSATTLGKMLGYYRHGEAYGRQTVYKWELPEKGERLPSKYAMSDQARYCYRRLLEDLVQATTDRRFELATHMGKRAWRFKLVATCKCGRKFEPRRRTARRCGRCIA